MNAAPTTASAAPRSDWQAADAAHYLHPFTDFKSLAGKGSRVITRAEGIYLWDSDGHKILDAMSGLWCVNVGYGRQELIDAATRQMRSCRSTTLLPDRDAAGDRARRAARRSHAAAVQARVLLRLRLRRQRHHRAHGAPLLGPAGPARAQRHHQPQQRATTARRWPAPRSAA